MSAAVHIVLFFACECKWIRLRVSEMTLRNTRGIALVVYAFTKE